VDVLEATLGTRGLEPFVDRREIQAIEDWWKRVQELIERADIVVLVVEFRAAIFSLRSLQILRTSAVTCEQFSIC
jgi:hypothetical protein